MGKKKKTSITVDANDFEEALRIEFDFVAKAFQIPRGKLLSRALYLACREIEGEKGALRAIVSRHESLQNTRPFDEDVLLDEKSWRKTIPRF